uniref:Uncharacterized protein n=1 Tax=Cacopsylla melanoneura TaxID=428564 RepID=A0A8D8TSD3_9HEMI
MLHFSCYSYAAIKVKSWSKNDVKRREPQGPPPSGGWLLRQAAAKNLVKLCTSDFCMGKCGSLVLTHIAEFFSSKHHSSLWSLISIICYYDHIHLIGEESASH